MNEVTDFPTIQELTQKREQLTQQLEQSEERMMELLEKEG